MELTSISSFKYLNWDCNKKCFIIDNSTDRKVASFLFNSVMPTSLLHKKQINNINPWTNKSFVHFKSRYLEIINLEFQVHVLNCPKEEYKAVLISFSKEFEKEIDNLYVEDSTSKEQALSLLNKICADYFIKLFSKPPLNMQQIYLNKLSNVKTEHVPALTKGQCYHYAFYLLGECEVMSSIFNYRHFDAAFLIFPKYFLYGVGYSESKDPKENDLVLYLGDPRLHNNAKFKHLAVLTERNTVKGRWGDFPSEFEHEIFQVPDAYGSEVVFFRKTFQTPEYFDSISLRANQILEIIEPFKKFSIPTPLTKEGVLPFLIQELRSLCKQANSPSNKWDWKNIEKNLKETVKCVSLDKPDPLLKDFQFWAQEALEECFISQDYGKTQL